MNHSVLDGYCLSKWEYTIPRIVGKQYIIKINSPWGNILNMQQNHCSKKGFLVLSLLINIWKVTFKLLFLSTVLCMG